MSWSVSVTRSVQWMMSLSESKCIPITVGSPNCLPSKLPIQHCMCFLLFIVFSVFFIQRCRFVIACTHSVAYTLCIYCLFGYLDSIFLYKPWPVIMSLCFIYHCSFYRAHPRQQGYWIFNFEFWVESVGNKVNIPYSPSLAFHTSFLSYYSTNNRDNTGASPLVHRCVIFLLKSTSSTSRKKKS